MGALLRCVAILLLVGAAGVARAQPSSDSDLRLVIEQLTVEKAFAIAVERQIADSRQQKLYTRLVEKSRAHLAAERRAAGNARELARMQRARDRLANQLVALRVELSRRDPTLPAAFASFRQLLDEQASSRDPRVREALRRRAEGEWREGLDDLDDIADANLTARNKAATRMLERAEAQDRRLPAWLALEDHDAGRLTVDDVMRRFERITKLDRASTAEWLVLAHLYLTQGRIVDARTASDAAYANVKGAAASDQQPSVLALAGDVAMRVGDLAVARSRYEESVAVARQLAARQPRSADAQRSLSLFVSRLGDVLEETGDLAGARARYEEALALNRKLVAADRHAEHLLYDQSGLLSNLAGLVRKQGDLATARVHYEASLAAIRKVAKLHPSSSVVLRSVIVTLGHLGEVLMESGALAKAKPLLIEAVTSSRKLARLQPSSTEAQLDLSVSVGRLGDLAKADDDLAAAELHYQAALEISRAVAKIDASERAQRELSVRVAKLGEVSLQRGAPAKAVQLVGESVALLREIARDNPTSAKARRDLVIGLFGMADVQDHVGDVRAAKLLLDEALTLVKPGEGRPSSGRARRDHSMILFRLGQLALSQGDKKTAAARFTEALALNRAAVAEDPSSAKARVELLETLGMLGLATDSREHLSEALQLAIELHRQGQLAPTDQWWMDKIPSLLTLWASHP